MDENSQPLRRIVIEPLEWPAPQPEPIAEPQAPTLVPEPELVPV